MKTRVIKFSVVVAAVWLGGYAISAQATPVTFAFEAEITEITPSINTTFTLPSELALGEILNGLVTFEPPFTFGQDTQGASLSASIDGVSMTASALTFDTARNAGGFAGTVGSLEDRVIVLANSSSNISSIIPSPLNIQLFGLLAIGDAGTVNPLVDRIEDIAVWNRFEDRRMIIDVQSESMLGDYSIIAALGPATLVPEPVSLTLTMTAVIIANFIRRRRTIGCTAFNTN